MRLIVRFDDLYDQEKLQMLLAIGMRIFFDFRIIHPMLAHLYYVEPNLFLME